MSINILTSMFPNGFTSEFAAYLNSGIINRRNFAFVASEFHRIHDKTDNYFKDFLRMFTNCGIVFDNAYVVDGRMSKEQASEAIAMADVVWLAGGDTPVQYNYLKEYGLIPILREHTGVIIGMSAGAINMGKLAICTITCEHEKQEIYPALGLVDISVEPHLNENGVTDELLQFSMKYPIYGMCDDSAIVFKDGNVTYMGEIFLIEQGESKKISDC
jgi:dipeptidase E